MEEEKIIELEHVLFKQLRRLGVELYDDAGNRMKPGGPEEIRVLRVMAVACQTPVGGSGGEQAGDDNSGGEQAGDDNSGGEW